MERENKSKKRGRGEEDKKDFSETKTAKKQDLDHFNNTNINLETDNNYGENDNYLSLGVFDFPWLKEAGMIFKSEDWNLEDAFSSSLRDTTATAGVEFWEPCLCETPATCTASIDFPEANLGEDVWSLEMEGLDVDCIWSSLLNQPLQQGTA